MEGLRYFIPVAITAIAPMPYGDESRYYWSDDDIAAYWSFAKTQNDIFDPVSFDAIDQVLEKLFTLELLEYNWDGSGAESLSEQVIRNSVEFIQQLPKSVVADLNPSAIVPTPYGTLVIDFSIENEVVSVEVGDSKIGFFSEFKDKNNPSLDAAPFSPYSIPSPLLETLNRLYKAKA